MSEQVISDHKDSEESYEKNIQEGGISIKGVVIVIIILLYQIAACLLYGYLFGYYPSFQNTYQSGDLLLISTLALLALIGFGLVNSYITNSAFSGMGLSLLIFGLTIQHYFLFRALWYKAGIWDVNSTNTFSDENTSCEQNTFCEENIFRQISYVNEGEDSQISLSLPVSSMADAIACSISLMVAFSSVVGRIAVAEIFVLTIFGTFCYELNNQLLWRLFISDTGYGMRIFVFGSFLGLIISLILGKKDTTVNHIRYISVYSSQSHGLIGLCFIFCAMPFLCATGLYRTSTNDSAILWVAPFNMWLSLIAGVLGSFCASTLSYRKVFLHDLVFSGISGGIAFSSSSDLHKNPAVPLTVGFITGLLLSLFNSLALLTMNFNGVITSLSTLHRFILPSFICAIISGVLHGVGATQIGSIYKEVSNAQFDRSYEIQGAFQLAGFGISVAIGIGGGLIIGLIIRLINDHDQYEQFDDEIIFHGDFNKEKYQTEQQN